jgi:hypothetical protein
MIFVSAFDRINPRIKCQCGTAKQKRRLMKRFRTAWRMVKGEYRMMKYSRSCPERLGLTVCHVFVLRTAATDDDDDERQPPPQKFQQQNKRSRTQSR